MRTRRELRATRWQLILLDVYLRAAAARSTGHRTVSTGTVYANRSFVTSTL